MGRGRERESVIDHSPSERRGEYELPGKGSHRLNSDSISPSTYLQRPRGFKKHLVRHLGA